ncbi:amino acid adenylation domain-containing protein [Streptomyces sp. NPDC088251]|uniref:non-ribosomal peptide synthetase n=1 Tax=unclassified Streptomyces TaxID=2593676 RepID=UPI00382A22FF
MTPPSSPSNGSTESGPSIGVGPDAAALSPAQQHVWLLGQLAPDSPLLHVAESVRMTGLLDDEDLEAALRTATGRHRSLAARFATVAGQPVRTWSHEPAVVTVRHDLRSLGTAQRAEREDELIAAVAAERFDVAQGPLARACLIRLGEQEHRLVLVLHGLVADQQSAQLLIGEVVALLRAAHEQRPFPAPRSDRADERAPRECAEAAVEAGTGLPEQAGLPTVPELPLDRPRPAWRDLGAESVPFEVSHERTALLRRLGESVDGGLPAVVLALYLTLLYRYSGQSDLAVALLAPGRAASGGEDAVGRFESFHPAKFEVVGELTAPRLARLVQEELVRRGVVGGPGCACSADPSSDLAASLSLPGFSLRSVTHPIGPPGIDCELLPVHCGAVLGDMGLHLTDDGSLLRGRLDFAADVFTADTARRAVNHLLRIIDGVLEDPHRPIACLPLLTADEERTINALNSVAVDAPTRPTTFDELFEEQVERRPEAPAVRAVDMSLTYGELNRRANQLAHLLKELGVGPGSAVGLAMERGAQLAVAVLGVLKAGGTYVPVELSDPCERREGILDDAAACVLLTAGPVKTVGSRQIVELDPTWTALEGRPTLNPAADRATTSQAAYLLYTSGSTGKPKGVVVEHQQLVSYIRAVVQRFGIVQPLRFAMLQPLAVDSSVTAFAVPLCTGGEVHMIPRSQALDAGLLADWTQEHGIDCLKIAPSHLRALQASPRFTELLPRRLLIVGGEASDWRWLSGIQRLVPDCRVFNHYGPTETTVGVLTLAVDEHPDADWGTAPIGVPLPGTQAYVVDGTGRQVPVGVPGELLIGGGNVARGYHGRDGLTAASFVPDRFGGRAGERLYRTGDMVRRLADGTIAFLGRKDDQIKVRGFRVALGEIDAAAKSHAQVRHVATIVREDLPGDRRIVTYVEPCVSEAFSPEDLERHLRAKLPPHMVPQALVALERLPLSAHGKIDRGALPVPACRPADDAALVPPQSDLERRVSAVWKELFRVDAVGVDQNFFDLGGHSLLLVELQYRLSAAMGRDVELLQLFQHTSVRAQAAYFGRPKPEPGPAGRTAPVVRPQQNALLKRRQQQLRGKRGQHE